MQLAERLRLLRGESLAPAPDPTEPGPGASLAERLVRLGRGAVPRPQAEAPLGSGDGETGGLIEQVLGGAWVAPGVLLVERRIPLTQAHGSVQLGVGLNALGELAGRVLGRVPATSGWCLLDTETSGLAGGTGTWVFACGLARPEGDALVLRQYLLARLDAEPAFLAALNEALIGCGLLVSYNGKSFDIPLLNTRFQLGARDGARVGNAGAISDQGARDGARVGNAGAVSDQGAMEIGCVGNPEAVADKGGLPPRLDGLPHLDLLHPMRRAFATTWPDCRLATAEARLLGLRRQGDLPGSEAPRAWLDWLRRGDTAGLAGVLGHNRLDLLSLAALPAPLMLTMSNPAETGADPLSVAGWHRDRGDPTRAWTILEANQTDLSPAGQRELARYRVRAGDWRGAAALLEPLAEAGDPDALVALAKLLEHRLGDPHRALALARRLPASPQRQRRCQRLEERLAGCGPSFIDLCEGDWGGGP